MIQNKIITMFRNLCSSYFKQLKKCTRTKVIIWYYRWNSWDKVLQNSLCKVHWQSWKWSQALVNYLTPVITMKLFANTLQIKSSALCFWCCATYVNISVFSISFWLHTDLVGQKGEELNRHTLWVDTELKMTGFLHMGEEGSFSSTVSHSIYLVHPQQKKIAILFSWEWKHYLLWKVTMRLSVLESRQLEKTCHLSVL